MVKTPVRVGGHVVGYHDGSTFFRSFDSRRHVLRVPVPSLSLDDHALVELQRDGVTRAEFTDSSTGDVYLAALSAFWEHGYPVERGYGSQHALPLSAFFVVSTSQPSLPGFVYSESEA